MKKNDTYWIKVTKQLAKKCTPVSTAFCVGAIIVDQYGNEVSKAYSRETEENKHAEEIAIEKALAKKAHLQGATLYSSLEPCGERVSGRKTCVSWILESGIKKVVFAEHEPSTFVKGEGMELLQDAGITVLFLETDE